MTVNTNKYRASHGKQPRGRGNWAFEIGGETHFSRGFYKMAKAWAIDVARARNVSEVTVLP